MQFIYDFGVIILASYLTLANSVAHQIESFFAETKTEYIAATQTETRPAEQHFSKLTSDFSEHTHIPTILIPKSNSYSASVIGSTFLQNQTSNPENAMVNIFCTYTTDEYIRTTTGSGFFISKTGALLTNAHVAQFLLLERAERPGETECILRTGNPATAQYEAELLYIPPAWVQKNADLVNATAPQGTGERDYALLYASATLDGAPLPANFPYISFSISEFSQGDEGQTIQALGYPAEPLQNGNTADLVLENATSSIVTFFTYAEETADLLAVEQTVVGQQGSSGGPALNTQGQAVGIIVTKSPDESEGFRALTIPYINRTITEETGVSLFEYTHGDIGLRANSFNRALTPFLVKLLEFKL